MQELKRLRKEKNWSQVRLAKESGVDRATINQVEGGHRSPTIETLEKLALAMGTEIADFFPKVQAHLPFDPGPTDKGLRLLRAWRAFAWTLAGDWAENPPQSSREITPLLAAITALVNQGVFEDSDADTAAQGELSLLRLALAKLAEISDAVEREEVADELRAAFALVPQDRNFA